MFLRISTQLFSDWFEYNKGYALFNPNFSDITLVFNKAITLVRWAQFIKVQGDIVFPNKMLYSNTLKLF